MDSLFVVFVLIVLVMVTIVKRVRTGTIVPACMAVMSLSFLGMAIFPTYGAILACYTVAYLLAPALNASIFSYAAVITPEQMQGRSCIYPEVSLSSIPLFGLTIKLPYFGGLLVTIVILLLTFLLLVTQLSVMEKRLPSGRL
jgi:hypothetical protein